MSRNQVYNKWLIELVNQEYCGNVKELSDTLIVQEAIK